MSNDMTDLGRQLLVCIGNFILAATKHNTAVEAECPEEEPRVEDSAQRPVVNSATVEPQEVGVCEILRRAFQNKGPMTTATLHDYLERQNDMEQLRKRYGEGALQKVRTALYQLKQNGELLKADARAETPWIPAKLKKSQLQRKISRGTPTAEPNPATQVSDAGKEDDSSAALTASVKE